MFDLLLEYWYLTTNGSIVYHHYEANDEFVKGHFLVNENVVVEINDSTVMDDVQQDYLNMMDVMVVEVVEVIVLENVLVEVVVEVLEDDDDDEHEDDDDAMDEKDDEVKPKVSIET